MNYSNDNPRRNASYCMDLTAHEAIKRIEAEEEENARFKKLLNTIFMICELSDFHLQERIVVCDKRTGKIWR